MTKSIVVNIAKVYLNLDRTVKKIVDPFISRGANNTVQIMLVAPFDIQNSMYVNFGLESEIEVPTRYMTLIATENSDDTDNEDWGVWIYTIGSKILAGAASNGSEDLDVTFSEYLNITESEQYEFIGFQSSEAALNANFPTPLDDQYAGVGEGTTIGTAVCYLGVSGVWVSQNKTVMQFEEDQGILRESFVGESQIATLAVDPNINTIDDEVDNTNLDVIFANISLLNGKVLAIEILLGEDGVNFVKSDLIAEYLPTSTPESDDQFYIQKNNGDKKRVSFSDIVEGARENFIGTFDTASGLTCPDPEDLLCEYPNGILDPDSRLGWVATVLFTGTKWSWSSTGNNWIDTGQAPSLAKDIGYTPTTDPTTTQENVQDAMVDHGIQIDDNKTKIVVLENKTQNLDENGDIKENIDILTTKDIDSVDLNTATGILGIVANIISHFTRIGNNETQIGINTTDILTKLQKDFSTLNSVVLDGNDLFVIQDDSDGLNKKVTLTELTAKIEGLISNDQGFYIDMTSLRSAIPSGQPGWFATIGGTEDTMAVWDVEGADWIEVASKLYYTMSAGLALEVRVSANELAIVANADAILLKFDIANLTSDVVGNKTNVTKAVTPKGTFDYVDPIEKKVNENRTYSTFIQTNNFISRVASETTLFKGREERMLLDGGFQVAVGIAQISIDGGLVYKNIAIYIPDTGWVDADLSLGLFFGERFLFIFDTVRDKWLAFLSDQVVSRALGATYQPFMSISYNYDQAVLLEARVSNLEGGSISGKSLIVQELGVSASIDVSVSTGSADLVKITLDVESRESNDINIITRDVDGDPILVENAEPGYNLPLKVEMLNTTAPSKAVGITVYVFDKNGTIAVGSEIDKIVLTTAATGLSADRFISTYINNDAYTFPLTLALYYANDVIDGVDADLEVVQFRQESKFTGAGISTSQNIGITTPLEETPSGVKTDQSEANKEFTILLNDSVETDKVQVAGYGSNGQFAFNNAKLLLPINKAIKVKFAEVTDDLELDVELRIVDTGTYYDVEFKETEYDLKVKHVSGEILDLYWTGVKFVTSYADAKLISNLIEYSASIGVAPSVLNPYEKAPFFSFEINNPLGKYRGHSAIQEVENGNFDSGDIVPFDAINIGVPVVSNGVVAFTPTAQNGNIHQSFNFIVGNTYCIAVEAKVTGSVGVRIDVAGQGQSYHSGGGNWERLISKFTFTGTSGIYDFALIEKLTTLVEIQAKNFMLIPLLSAEQQALTASELALRYPKYWEGLDSVRNPLLYVVNKNLFDGIYELGDIQVGNGILTSSTVRMRSKDKIYVIPNETYTMWNDLGYLNLVFFYDIDENYISETSTAGGNKTFVVPSNCEYVLFRHSTNELDTEVKTMFEIGNTATTYIKHAYSFQYYHNQSLRSLPNGVEDYIDTFDNSLHELTNEIVLESSNFIAMATSKTNYDSVYTDVDFIPVLSFQHYLCEQYTVNDGVPADSVDSIGLSWIEGDRLRFGFAKGTSLATAQSALEGLKLIYQLETEVITLDVDQDGIALAYPSMTVQLSSDSGIVPIVEAQHSINNNATIQALLDQQQNLEKQVTKLEDEVEILKADLIVVEAEVDTKTSHTILLSIPVDIDDATAKPTSNITLSESMAGFDKLQIKHSLLDGTVFYQDVKLDANGDEVDITCKTTSTTSTIQYGFRLYRDSETTMTAYAGESVVQDYSANTFTRNGNINQDVLEIVGVKYGV